MKTFKLIDFWVSAGLIISFTVISLIEGFEDFLHNKFLLGYFVVGGWQVMSMLVHIISRTFMQKSGARFTYNWIALFAIITMPLGSFYFLLYLAPFMAIYYTCLCYREVYIKMQRPLAVLK